MNDKTVIITATVSPLKNGKRTVIVSAAPEGEMPVIRAGNFANLKNMFDMVWVDLLKRDPQVVDKTQKTKTKAKAKPVDAIEQAQAEMSASIAAHAEDDKDTDTGEFEESSETGDETAGAPSAEVAAFEEIIARMEAQPIPETPDQTAEADQLVHIDDTAAHSAGLAQTSFL